MKKQQTQNKYSFAKQANGVIFVNSTAYEFDSEERSINGAFVSPKQPTVLQIRDDHQISHGRAKAFIDRLSDSGGIPQGVEQVMFQSSGRTYNL